MSRRLRLVFVCPMYAPSYAAGGVVRSTSEVAAGLAARGHDVTVLTSDIWYRKDLPVPDRRLPSTLAGERIVDGVKVVYHPHRVPRLQWQAGFAITPSLKHSAAAHLVDADVVHLQEVRTYQNLVVVKEAARANVPFVISPHGTIPTQTGRKMLKRLFDVFFMSRIRRAEKFVALNAAEAADIEKWGIPKSSIAIVANGVKPSGTIPARGPLRLKLGIPQDAFVALFLGRVHDRKRIDRLIEAMALLARDDAHLIVAGGDDGARERLERLTDERSLRGRVHFLGAVDEPTKWECYANADVFTLTSDGEGLPMTALEAGLSGLPMILTPGARFDHAVAAGAALLVTGEASSIANALTKLQRDAALRRTMGASASKLVSAEYSLDSQLDALEHLYEEVSASHARGP